jgi:hypothetical protein
MIARASPATETEFASSSSIVVVLFLVVTDTIKDDGRKVCARTQQANEIFRFSCLPYSCRYWTVARLR